MLGFIYTNNLLHGSVIPVPSSKFLNNPLAYGFGSEVYCKFEVKCNTVVFILF